MGNLTYIDLLVEKLTIRLYVVLEPLLPLVMEPRFSFALFTLALGPFKSLGEQDSYWV